MKPRTQVKISGVVSQACQPFCSKVEAEISLGLAGQPVSPIDQPQVRMRDLLRKKEDDIQDCALVSTLDAPEHACAERRGLREKFEL